MLKDLFFMIKYPYTTGVIAIIWFGSTGMILLNQGLPIARIVTTNMIATFIIGIIGFMANK